MSPVIINTSLLLDEEKSQQMIEINHYLTILTFKYVPLTVCFNSIV